MSKLKDMIYPIQQFFYELVYARDISKQFNYMHEAPYRDGFKAGVKSSKRMDGAILKLHIKTIKKWDDVPWEDKLWSIEFMVNSLFSEEE